MIKQTILLTLGLNEVRVFDANKELPQLTKNTFRSGIKLRETS